MNFPKRELLSLRVVLAFPIAYWKNVCKYLRICTATRTMNIMKKKTPVTEI